MTTNTFVDLAPLARHSQAAPLPIRAYRALLCSTALLAVVFAGAVPTAAQADRALPTGGAVTSGTATISTGAGHVAITQSTDRAIIDWQSFSVGPGNVVTFVQPGSNSATLNRVTGTAGSEIAGQIRANGAVYLVNPNGIAITASGNVKTGGGFIASTLDIKDGDFNAGKLAFAGKGASASVRNSGSVAAGQGAYVALLGGSVANSGTISVPLGLVGLGSGEQIALDINGAHFMQVGVPTKALVAGGGALIDMRGAISVSGGRAVLSAATARSAVRNVINLSGSINADAAVGSAGSITLLGGDGGTVIASGALSARATGAAGSGGTVETSGVAVNFAGLKVDTSAAGGQTGTWLVDPTDLTVDAAAARTIKINLATSNVTLTTSGDAAPSGPGVASPGNGDLTIASALSWTSANTLTLSAYHNIAINAAIKAPKGGLTVAANNSGYQPASIISASAPVSVGTFVLNSGNWVQNGATLPTFSATKFSFNPQNGSFLRASGGDGTVANPYMLTDIYGLQGLRSWSLLDQNYVLASDINASGATNWNDGAGFAPIGYNQPFTGSLDGKGHKIAGLTIVAAADNVGLFASEKGVIANLQLVGGSISNAAHSSTGALAGYQGGGTITNVTSSAVVNGLNSVGGLVGTADGQITGSRTTGAVTSSGSNVGGLVGWLGYYVHTASISASSARGNVTVTSGRADSVGGLVGFSTGTIDRSFATGAVTGTGNVSIVGGLVGQMCSLTSGCSGGDSPLGSITHSFSTGNVSAGSSDVGGLVGLVSTGNISNSYAKGKVTSVGTSYYTGGLVGYSAGTNTFSSVYATGDVTGQASVGGLVGSAGGNGSTKIIGAHATGDVISGQQDGNGGGFGGLVGDLGGDSSVTRSYATGDVTNKYVVNGYGRSVGGLIGAARGRVTYSHASGAVSGTNDNVGGLIGTDNDISGLVDTGNYATGNVTGNTLPDGYFNGAAIGGLIGVINTSKTITKSYATGDVSAISHSRVYAGGLIGIVGNAKINISKSYASGNVSVTGAAAVNTIDGAGLARNNVDNQVGGLIGIISAGYGRIEQVYAAGNVATDGQHSEIGGLVGSFYDGSNGGLILNSIAKGSVTATGHYAGSALNDQATDAGGGSYKQNIGGLIGRLNSGKVASSYALGTVAGFDDVGGLFGYTAKDGIVLADYWNTDTVGRNDPGATIPGDNLQGGKGLTTKQMQDPANYAATFKGWDFMKIWTVPTPGTYPGLRAFNP